MIRIIIWAALFCGGLWAGAEYERVSQIDRCLNAGGSADPRGFCMGVDQ